MDVDEMLEGVTSMKEGEEEREDEEEEPFESNEGEADKQEVEIVEEEAAAAAAAPMEKVLAMWTEFFGFDVEEVRLGLLVSRRSARITAASCFLLFSTAEGARSRQGSGKVGCSRLFTTRRRQLLLCEAAQEATRTRFYRPLPPHNRRLLLPARHDQGESTVGFHIPHGRRRGLQTLESRGGGGRGTRPSCPWRHCGRQEQREPD